MRRFRVAAALSWLVPSLAAAEPPASDAGAEKALSAALARLEDKPGDADALREVLNLSRAAGGVRGLVTRYEARATERPKDAGVRIVLAHLQRESGHCAEAVVTYDAAAALDTGPSAWLGKAACQAGTDGAFESLRTAAEHAKGDERLTILQALLDAALSAERPEIADEAYAALVKAAPRDLFLRTELARRISDAGRLTQAITIWKDIKKSAAGDQKIVLLATTELGHLLVRTGDADGAIALYTEALSGLPAEHWAEPDLRLGLVDAYRRAGRLADYVQSLEKNQRTYPELLTLAELYEETGQEKKAVEAYRRAVKERPRNVDAQEALLRIVQRTGTDADLEAEYRRLAKDNPDDPMRELDLADLLFRTNRAKAGLDLLAGLSRRYSNDPFALSAVGQLMVRYDAPAAAIEQLYGQLMKLEPSEEAHIIALGEYYFSVGQKDRAVEVWNRIERSMKSAGKAQSVLARLFADHEMATEADGHYRRAIELAPTKVAPQRSYALFLERTKRGADAIAAWEKVHGLIDHGELDARREARRHIAQLAVGLGQLDQRITVWQSSASPDDRLLLAEGLLAARRLDEADKLLASADASDVEALLYRSEVLEKLNRAAESLTVLEALVARDPTRAAPRLRRMAELAQTLGRGPDALKYAKKAVDLDPNDSEAQEYLGDIHAAQGNLDEALAAQRRAVSLDKARMPARFKLARTLERTGREDECARTLVEIVEKSNDPNDILAAGRALSGLGGVDALGRLESVLVRLSGAQPKKTYYRELLLDVYATLAERWMNARGSKPAEAQAQLKRIGEQSLRPVLDALAGSDSTLRNRVLRVIMATRPAEAAPALARRLGDSDRTLVFQSLVALAHVGASTGLDGLSGLASGRDTGLGNAAIWALGTTMDVAAAKLLASLATGTEARADRGLAVALALGGRGRADGVEAAIELLRSGDISARAAAAWALGVIGEPRAATSLEDRLPAESGDTRAAIAWALGAIGQPHSLQALLTAAWSSSDDGLVLSDAIRTLGAGKHPSPAALHDAYLSLANLPESRIDLESAFPLLLVGTGAPRFEQAGSAVLERHAAIVKRALLGALAASEEAAQLAVLSAITADAGLVFGPAFPDTALPGGWRGDLDAAIAPHAASGSPWVRVAAVRALVGTTGDVGRKALVAALGDEVPSVASAAAMALAGRDGASGTAERPLLQAARGRLGETAFGRALACRALGRLATRDSDAVAYLVASASDTSAAVRAEAVSALAGVTSGASSAAIVKALADADPGVVSAAIGAARRAKLSDARAALEALSTGPNPSIRMDARRALAP